MFFAVQRTISATLNFNVPADYCCNCGRRTADVDLITTPLRQVRSVLFYGEEIRLSEQFPFCKPCRGSAGRSAFGWPGKLLLIALNSVILFGICIGLLPSSLPHAINDNLYSLNLILAVILTLAWFHQSEKIVQGRTHYQPVRLREAHFKDDRLRQVSLAFHNRHYAQDFANANAEAVKARVLLISILD